MTKNFTRFLFGHDFVTLDAGEAEAIPMSLEWPADLLTMDESSGRAPLPEFLPSLLP